MNTKERMIKAYLQQANLPEVEKEKLSLFLHLLDAVEEAPTEGAALPALQDGKGDAGKKTPPATAEDPLVEAVKRRMQQEGLTKAEVTERLSLSTVKTIDNFLDGKPVRVSTRDLIASWMQTWMMAEEIVKN